MPEPLITPVAEALGRRGRVPTAFVPANRTGVNRIGTNRNPVRGNRATRRGNRTGRVTGTPGATRLRGAGTRAPSRGRGARDNLNRNSTPSGRDRRTGRG